MFQWCEARPECNRRDLKSYLAMPMQRLTKYPLLISAISKKTADPAIKQRLDQIVRYMIGCIGTHVGYVHVCGSGAMPSVYYVSGLCVVGRTVVDLLGPPTHKVSH